MVASCDFYGKVDGAGVSLEFLEVRDTNLNCGYKVVVIHYKLLNIQKYLFNLQITTKAAPLITQ